jgi:hypothetical protein
MYIYIMYTLHLQNMAGARERAAWSTTPYMPCHSIENDASCLVCNPDTEQFVLILTCGPIKPWPRPENFILMCNTLDKPVVSMKMDCSAQSVSLPRFSSDSERQDFLARMSHSHIGAVIPSGSTRMSQSQDVAQYRFDYKNIVKETLEQMRARTWVLVPVSVLVGEIQHASVSMTYQIFPNYWTYHGIERWLENNDGIQHEIPCLIIKSKVLDVMIVHKNDALLIYMCAELELHDARSMDTHEVPPIIQQLHESFPDSGFRERWATLCGKCDQSNPAASSEELYSAKLFTLRREYIRTIEVDGERTIDSESRDEIEIPLLLAGVIGYLNATTVAAAHRCIENMDMASHWWNSMFKFSQLFDMFLWDDVLRIGGSHISTIFDLLLTGGDMIRVARWWFEKLALLQIVSVPPNRVLFHATLDRWPAHAHADVPVSRPWWHGGEDVALTTNGLYTSLFPAFSALRMFWDPSEHDFPEHHTVELDTRSKAHPGALLALGSKTERGLRFLDTSVTKHGRDIWYHDLITYLFLDGVWASDLEKEAYKVHFIAESGDQSEGERARIAILFWWCEESGCDGFMDFSELDPLHASASVPVLSHTDIYDRQIDNLRVDTVRKMVWAREFVLCRKAAVTVRGVQNFGSIHSGWLVALMLQARIAPDDRNPLIKCGVLSRHGEDDVDTSWWRPLKGSMGLEGLARNPEDSKTLMEYVTSIDADRRDDRRFLLFMFSYTQDTVKVINDHVKRVDKTIFSELGCDYLWDSYATRSRKTAMYKSIHLLLPEDMILTIISMHTNGFLCVGILNTRTGAHAIVPMPFMIYWFNLLTSSFMTYTVVHKADTPSERARLPTLDSAGLDFFLRNHLAIIGMWNDSRTDNSISFILDCRSGCLMPFTIPDWFYRDMSRHGERLIGMGFDKSIGIIFITIQTRAHAGGAIKTSTWRLDFSPWAKPPLPRNPTYNPATLIATRRMLGLRL